jgi:hypothetical protein
MRLHSHARPDTPASAYGAAGEYAAWQAVQDAYKADRLEEAFDAAKGLGAGIAGFGLYTFRMIEAEQFTRTQSHIAPIAEGLDLEIVEDEVPDRPVLTVAVTDALREASTALGIHPVTPILVTLLAAAANTPWTPGRHGFCMAKIGFTKICLPFDLLEDRRELALALRHEFSHALARDAAAGLCPMWLDEAVAMVVGEGPAPRAATLFRHGSLPWLTEAKLDGAFRADRESDGGRSAVWAAYQQSALLGAHLVKAGGLALLGRTLEAHVGNPWDRFWSLVRNERPTDRALRTVYGYPTRELFRRTRTEL